jgi:hypothetical protein
VLQDLARRPTLGESSPLPPVAMPGIAKTDIKAETKVAATT